MLKSGNFSISLTPLKIQDDAAAVVNVGDNNCDDDDYGFFADFEDGNSICLIPSGNHLPFGAVDPSASFSSEGLTSCSASTKSTPVHRSGSSSSMALSDSTSEEFNAADDVVGKEELNIVCEVADEQAPVSCRTFSDGDVATVSIVGFRLVEDSFGEEAEFNVCLSVNSRQYRCWRRFNDFEQLTHAIVEFADYLNMLSKHRSDPLILKNVVRTWRKLKKLQPVVGVPMSAQIMVSLTAHLKVLLKHLLYETPSLEHLVQFCQEC